MSRIAHALVSAIAGADLARFESSRRDLGQTQEDILLKTLAANADSRYGREHSFASVRSRADFRRLVPFSDYESLRSRVEAIRSPRDRELTGEDVILFEPTSGSSGAKKLIPYTRGLRRQFSRGANAWIADLYRAYPGIRMGRHLWSITPAARTPAARSQEGAKRTKGMREGFDDDSGYLGLAGSILKRIFLLPSRLKDFGDMEDYYAAVSALLASAGDLSLVSVWNPAAFSIMLENLERHAEGCVFALMDGRIQLPSGSACPFRLPRDPDRARFFAKAAEDFARTGDKRAFYAALWPRLALVSAWGDAESAAGFEELRSLFPKAAFQKKGLLATEGIMTFPLSAAGGNVLAITSHFFEFLPEGEEAPIGMPGPALSAGELEPGKRYSIILTTAGGLYRYCIGDSVSVRGWYGGIPLLDFVSRRSVVDLCGEKLHEDFARSCLERARKEAGIETGFCMLAPDSSNGRPCYTLYAEAPSMDKQGERAAALLSRLENLLCENYHYDYARRLGQLAPPRLFLVSADGRSDFIKAKAADGMRLGDVKMRALDSGRLWSSLFKGGYSA
jgi:hypothetical protein